MTEYSIVFAMQLGKAYDFKIDPTLELLHDKIVDLEKTDDYKIQLDIVDGQVVLLNAANDLLEYINSQCGGLKIDNLIRLIDMSSVLGYTVSTGVLSFLTTLVPGNLAKYFVSRFINVDKSDTPLDEIMQYASLTNRLPVHIYDTSTPKKDQDNVIYLNNKSSNVGNIKLMISPSPILVGGRKQTWLTNAEKIIILK